MLTIEVNLRNLITMFDVEYDFGMCNISAEQSETTNSGLTAINLEAVGLTVFQFCPAAFCLSVYFH